MNAKSLGISSPRRESILSRKRIIGASDVKVIAAGV